MKVIDVLEMFKEYAAKYKKAGIVESVKRNSHMNTLSRKTSLTEDEAIAVVVDFLNFVGMQNCVDYGLYTRDL